MRLSRLRFPQQRELLLTSQIFFCVCTYFLHVCAHANTDVCLSMPDVNLSYHSSGAVNFTYFETKSVII